MDRLFEARLSDMVTQCGRGGSAVYSHFLDERQCAEAEQWCRGNCGTLRYKLWGGYEKARRRILAVYEDWYEDYVIESCPMKCLTFTFRREDKLSHRDFLGSFMAQQLKREVVGDIVVGEGIAQAFVTDVGARLIGTTVTKIGRVGVKLSDDRGFCLEETEKFQDIGGTVASMRLDCIVGLAAGLSREKAAQLIRSERVEINHFPVTSVSAEVHEGDVLSIRGSGRFILDNIGVTTKKGRIHVSMRKYI